MADLQALLTRADAGEAEAQHALGNAYHLGLSGATAHLPTAMRWYQRAAAQGHTGAQINLGVIFIQDIVKAGGTRNPQQAQHWFTRAADQGDAQGMCFLGRLASARRQSGHA